MLEFHDWIERHLGKWTARETFTGLMIVGVCITIMSVAWVVTQPKSRMIAASASDAQVPLKRWRNRDDSNGFFTAEDLGLDIEDDNHFDVAWISGSPISLRRAPPEWRLSGKSGFEMTDVLARYLVSFEGQPVRIQEFLLQGMRTGDMRRGVLFATEQEDIDTFIVEANPIWLLNDYLQFTKSRQRASIFRLGQMNWFDFGVAMRLLSPSDIGFEILGNLVPLVRDRYALFSHVSLGASAPFPFTKPSSPPGDGFMNNTWQRLFFPELRNVPVAEEAARFVGYRNIVLMNNSNPASLGMRFFVENVKTLAATGKPVLIIIPPLNPVLGNDAAAVEHLEGMVSDLRRAFDEVGSSNVRFVTETVWLNEQPNEFLDAIHMSHGQGAIDHIIGLLEDLLGSEFTKRPLNEVYSAQR